MPETATDNGSSKDNGGIRLPKVLSRRRTKKMRLRKIISLLLAAVMVFGLTPVSIYTALVRKYLSLISVIKSFAEGKGGYHFLPSIKNAAVN